MTWPRPVLRMFWLKKKLLPCRKAKVSNVELHLCTCLHCTFIACHESALAKHSYYCMDFKIQLLLLSCIYVCMEIMVIWYMCA
jgi:hypothetical protein